jgi:hypothetical protein
MWDRFRQLSVIALKLQRSTQKPYSSKGHGVQAGR